MGRIRSGRTVLALAIAMGVVAQPAAAAVPDWNATCTTEAAAGSPFAVGNNCRLISIDGYPRQYIVSLPATTSQATAAGTAVPLVVMLHGSGGDGGQFSKISGWAEKAEANGFVAVFPTGLVYRVTEPGEPVRRNTKWNDFTLSQNIDPSVKPDDYPPTAPWPANDVSFIRSLVADVSAQLPIDPNRVFISGFSNGGQMCLRLAVEASDLFAAAGCSAGNLESGHPTTPPNPNMPVTLSLGTLDDRALAQIQTTDPSVSEIPLDPAQMLAIQVIAASVNNVLGDVFLRQEPRVDTTAVTFTNLHWEKPTGDNDDGNSFDFLVLKDVEHEYPNGKNNPNGFVMADLFWDFFSAHPMDTKAPRTKIKKEPDSRADSRAVTYKFSSDDPGATFECKLDDQKYKHCKSPKRYHVKLGKHTFSVRAIDSHGNVDSTPAKDKFSVIE
jgi:polyhydroxybutyrate depolymerase